MGIEDTTPKLQKRFKVTCDACKKNFDVYAYEAFWPKRDLLDGWSYRRDYDEYDPKIVYETVYCSTCTPQAHIKPDYVQTKSKLRLQNEF